MVEALGAPRVVIALNSRLELLFVSFSGATRGKQIAGPTLPRLGLNWLSALEPDEDEAIVGGLGRFEGESVCVLGQEKGDDTGRA
jgi:hypothetical protein